MPELKTKTFSAQIKVDDDEQGVIIARFATFNVIDHDGDIIRPKSVGKQKIYAGLFNHADGLPPGDAETYEETDGPYARIRYDQEDPEGLRHYRFLKRRANAKLPVEWSMRFYIEKGGLLPEKDPLYEPNVGFFDGGGPYEIKKMDIVSVDPVGRGAGINTATVEAKECGPACEARRAGESGAASLDYDRLAQVIAEAVVKAMAVTATTTTTAPPLTWFVPAMQPEAKGQSLADLVRELRDERELSNDDLAEATGLSIGTVGQILGGTLVPAAATLQSLADTLGTQLSTLAAAAEADAPPEPEPDPEPQPEPEPVLAEASASEPETKADLPDAAALLTDTDRIIADGAEPTGSEPLVAEMEAILAGLAE